MGKRNKGKSDVEKNSDWGVWILFIIVVTLGTLAYHYQCLGEKWTKVLEIVGAPFSLGLGFFAFEKASDMIVEHRKNAENK
ncbi:hypothetical protein ACTGZO_10155 [Streptococcus suis]